MGMNFKSLACSLIKLRQTNLFITTKVKNSVPWIYVIRDLNGKEIFRAFYKKELQKINQRKFRIEKLIKRKGDKLYFMRKGYGNSFNSFIDKKDIVI